MMGLRVYMDLLVYFPSSEKIVRFEIHCRRYNTSNYQTGISVCYSLNCSSDLLHMCQVCCWGPKEVYCIKVECTVCRMCTKFNILVSSEHCSWGGAPVLWLHCAVAGLTYNSYDMILWGNRCKQNGELHGATTCCSNATQWQKTKAEG